MFIKSVKVTNFRGLREASFQFDEYPFVLLAAPNGIGKTSVIDAIEWCLTGSIGRLKNSYDLRSTNDTERKINVNGILKYKDAAPEDWVSVEVCIGEGDEEHKIYRSQKKDELGYSGKGTKLQIDGKKHEEGDWLNRCIDHNFYNFHFCDIQKSLGIQNEKRSSLSEMFKEFVTDYSDEECVAENLKLFQRDVGLKIEEKKKEKKNVENEKSSIEEKLNSFENEITFQEYPGTAMYEGEIVDLQGKNQKLLREQQNVIYTCGYSYVSDILKNLIENQKNEELCKSLDSLIQELQENNDDILEAIKVGLYKENTCITEVTNKIEEYSAIILNRNTILEKGQILLELKNNDFADGYFEQKKKKIQDLEDQIKILDESIQTVSEGNEIIEVLTELIDKKQSLLEYRNLKLKENGKARCPVCGSEKFAEIEQEQILKEANDYLKASKISINEKIEERKSKKEERDELKDELISKGKHVLEAEIQKQNKSKEKLLKIQKSTKDFFALQKKVSGVLKDKDEIFWWSSIANLINEKKMLEAKQSPKEELSKRKSEAYDILDVLNFKTELADTDQAVLNKISIRAENAPKILTFTKMLLIGKINALSYRIQDQEIAELDEKLKNSQNALKKINKEIDQIEKVKDFAISHEKRIRNLVAELIQQEYENVGPNLYKFYKKLSRINTIQNIKITPDGKENQVSLTDETGKHVVNILSNGQLSVFILAYFFAGIVSRGKKENFKIYFIDDLTACMDDVNMLSFLDLLKYLLKDKEEPIDQLFFVTCDDRIEKLLCYKMEGCEIPYKKLTEKNFPKY